jgi:hypothetical protein
VVLPEQSKYTTEMTLRPDDPTRIDEIYAFVPALRRSLRAVERRTVCPDTGYRLHPALALRILETGPPVAQQSAVINPCDWFVLGQGSASEQFSALTTGLGEEFAH